MSCFSKNSSTERAFGTCRKPRFQLILVVESDDALRERIERHLVLRGFFVMGASTIFLANELAAENDFDAVIANLTLRDDTSFALMSKLRETRSISGVSISQYGDSFERFQSNSAGFRAHLKTPLDLDLLVRQLREISE